MFAKWTINVLSWVSPWIFYQNELLDSLFVQLASQVESLFCFISWPIPSIYTYTIYTVHILIQMYAFPIFSVSFPMLRKPTCPKKMRETDHRFPEILYKLTVFFRIIVAEVQGKPGPLEIVHRGFRWFIDAGPILEEVGSCPCQWEGVGLLRSIIVGCPWSHDNIFAHWIPQKVVP